VRIEADTIVPFPRELVFRAYRDELPNVVAFLPNVRSIEIKDRKEEGGLVKLHNVWHGGGDIPAALRAVVDEKVLRWDDFASWDETSFTGTWSIRTHAFTEAVSCSGVTKMLPVGPAVDGGGKCRVELTGDFNIDAKKLSGIPSFMAGSLGKAVESFLAKQITANLASTTEGLSRYLASKA
jgi:hypothetical protein